MRSQAVIGRCCFAVLCINIVWKIKNNKTEILWSWCLTLNMVVSQVKFRQVPSCSVLLQCLILQRLFIIFSYIFRMWQNSTASVAGLLVFDLLVFPSVSIMTLQSDRQQWFSLDGRETRQHKFFKVFIPPTQKMNWKCILTGMCFFYVKYLRKW